MLAADGLMPRSWAASETLVAWGMALGGARPRVRRRASGCPSDVGARAATAAPSGSGATGRTACRAGAGIPRPCRRNRRTLPGARPRRRSGLAGAGLLEDEPASATVRGSAPIRGPGPGVPLALPQQLNRIARVLTHRCLSRECNYQLTTVEHTSRGNFWEISHSPGARSEIEAATATLDRLRAGPQLPARCTRRVRTDGKASRLLTIASSRSWRGSRTSTSILERLRTMSRE